MSPLDARTMAALKRPAQQRFELGGSVARGLVRRTRGVGRGPITGLMSPGDVGAIAEAEVATRRAAAGRGRFGGAPADGRLVLFSCNPAAVPVASNLFWRAL